MDADRLSAQTDGVHLLAQALARLPEQLPALPRFEDDDRRLRQAAAEHQLEHPLEFWLGGRDRQPKLAAERLWRERQLTLLHEILGTLEASGIEAAALKGPVLVERLYPAGAGRSSVDLDILVADADVDSALALLDPMGFRPVRANLPLAAHRRHKLDVELERPHSPNVELHSRLSVLFGRINPSEPALARKKRYRTSAGGDVWVLAPEDEFLFLALHAAKHAFHRLVWLFELKLYCLRYPELDWDIVSARARQMSVQTPLWAAAEALSARLGFEVPRVRLRLEPSALARRVWSLDRHMRSECGRPDSLRWWLAHHVDHLVLCDNTWRRMAYVHQQVGRGVRWKLARLEWR